MKPIWSDLDDTALTLQTAIEGDSEIEALPADTSPGWPWTERGFKTKGEAVLDPEVREFLALDWDELNTPSYTPTGWTMNLKDELRPIAKAARPRAFMGGPLEMVIHGKRLFGRQDAAITYNPLKTPVRVGFTPFHGGMRALWREHEAKKYHWDGDYHNWDGSVPTWLLYACMQVRMHFLHPSDWYRVWNYYRSVAYACMVDPYGNQIAKKGGMPSGTYTTATDNSIMNLIVLYMYEQHVGADDFVVSVYGDDNVVSTDAHFDLSSVTAFMSSLGLEYTGAEKDGPPTFKLLSECSFLKMNFSPCEARYPWREWERIFAIMEWCKKGTHEIFLSRLASSLLLSYGTTAYLSMRAYADSLRSRDKLAFTILPDDDRCRQIVVGDFAGAQGPNIPTYVGPSIL